MENFETNFQAIKSISQGKNGKLLVNSPYVSYLREKYENVKWIQHNALKKFKLIG